MKNYLVGFSIALIAALAIFFFYIVPERKKIEEKIKVAYQKGYDECYEDIDTVFIPGEPEIIYRDKIIEVEKPAEIVPKNDSVYYTAASIDTTFKSGKDEIGIKATVGMEINVNRIFGETDIAKTLIPITQWFMELRHKDFECVPDTVKIKVPKILERVELETNWLYIFISFLTGNAIMLLALLL